MRKLLTALIGFYQYVISPFLGNNCRTLDLAQELQTHGEAENDFLSNATFILYAFAIIQ